MSWHPAVVRCSPNCPLIYAISINDVDKVKCILDKGFDVDVHFFSGKKRKPAVCYCIELKYYEMAKLFVERGCSLSCTTADGMSPLQLAVLNGSEEFVEYLIENRADVNARRGLSFNPLHIACTTSCSSPMTIVRMLCEANAQLDITGLDGRTPLILACCNGLTDVAVYLIGKGAQVNVVDRNGFSALKYAISGYHKPVLVDALLEHGAQIRDENRDFLLPIVFLYSVMTIPAYKLKANQLDNLHVLQSLFNAGCDVNTLCVLGRNALHYAANSKQALLVKCVMNSGCAVSVADSLGNTGLFYACRNGDKASVELILAAGVDRRLETEWLQNEERRNVCKEELVRICLTELAQPLNLTEICRISLRQTAAPNIEQGVRSLPLPNLLKDYLVFDY